MANLPDLVVHTAVEAKQNARVPKMQQNVEEISRELLSDHPDLTDKMKDRGWTLLHCASFVGRDDFVAQILSVNPDVVDQATTEEEEEEESLTALDLAIQQGHESVALRILEMCPSQADKVTSNGVTVLHRAAGKGGWRRVVQHLLTTDPRMVNAVTHQDQTALHYAAHKGDSTVFSLLLTVNPALINQATANGWTPVHMAAKEGHAELVASLVAKNVNLTNTKNGWTAMHVAAEAGHLSVVKYLHTARPGLIHATTSSGWNVVHVALDKGHSAVAMYLLTEVPTLIDAANEFGSTPLHFAAERGLAEVVAHILGVDAKLSNADRGRGSTALHEAASNGHVAVAEQLLAANPSLIDVTTEKHGRTALHVAALRGQSAMVSYLLSVSPAAIDARSARGETALHFAASAWGCAPAQPKPTMETLLALKPELISMKSKDGNTVLHSMVESCRSREFLEHMWRLYPEASRAVNEKNHTPFHVAVARENGCAIELFQWELSWEEIKDAYDKRKKSCLESQRRKSAVERFKPVLETQCEGLSEVLLPDVVQTVFEYLGFERVKRPHTQS